MMMGRWRRNRDAGRRRLKRAHIVAPAASRVFRSHPVKQVRRPHSNGSLPSMFSREGGSPVWVPAFAGKHARRRRPRNLCVPPTINGPSLPAGKADLLGGFVEDDGGAAVEQVGADRQAIAVGVALALGDDDDLVGVGW